MDMMDREDRLRSARIAVAMALLLSLAFVWAAIAGARPAKAGNEYPGEVWYGSQGPQRSVIGRTLRHAWRVKRHSVRLISHRAASPFAPRAARVVARAQRGAGLTSRPHADVSCLPASLRAALARVEACGVRVISTHRPGATIAGTRTRSKHATCEAADFTASDRACVLARLASFPGKLSTDYWRVRHFHIDNGRYARFVHARSSSSRVRDGRANKIRANKISRGNILRRYAEGGQ